MNEKTDVVNRTEPHGIGGWLVLPIIGLIVVIGYSCYTFLQILIHWENFKLIFLNEGGTATEVKFIVGFSFFGSFIVLITASLALFQIYKRSSRIVETITIHYSVLFLVALLEVWFDRRIAELIPGTPRDPETMTQLARTLFAIGIWLPYFYRSKRVKNTFTNP